MLEMIDWLIDWFENFFLECYSYRYYARALITRASTLFIRYNRLKVEEIIVPLKASQNNTKLRSREKVKIAFELKQRIWAKTSEVFGSRVYFSEFKVLCRPPPLCCTIDPSCRNLCFVFLAWCQSFLNFVIISPITFSSMSASENIVCKTQACLKVKSERMFFVCRSHSEAPWHVWTSVLCILPEMCLFFFSFFKITILSFQITLLWHFSSSCNALHSQIAPPGSGNACDKRN